MTSTNSNKNYNTLIEFGKFLRENCDKLFEKDSKLSVKVDQLLILQDYLQPVTSSSIRPSTSSKNDTNKRQININSKEYLLLYKSNQLHFIQDFLFKITHLKISGDTNTQLNFQNDFVNLNIFGSLIYLEIKNWSVTNIIDLQNLRNQLEFLVCLKSVKKVQDLLHFCGGDQSMPITWPKLHTLNLSYNQFHVLDNSFRLATSIEILDLSHNNLKDCGNHLHHLKKLKKLNLSFNKLEAIPSLCDSESTSTVQYIDLSYNNIELLSIENLNKLANVEEINLRNNLLNNIFQLNNFRLLTSVKNVLIEGNPVNLNPNSQIIVKEILTVIKLKKNLKNRQSVKTLATSATTNSNSYRKSFIQTQPTYINSNRSKSLAMIDNDNNGYARSAPNKYSIDEKTRQRSSTLRQDNKRRLKPNVILIEQDNIIDEQTEPISEDVDNIANSLSSTTLQLNKQSKSASNHYDPNKLRLEIEMMKKMRQSYGTDWLLSTPNLNSNSSNINNSLNLINPSKSTIQPSPNNNLSTVSNNSTNNKLSIDEINNIIDSYAVYRSIEPISNNLNDDQDENSLDSSIIICILSLTDLYIVEKDETNMELLSINKYTDLADVKLINEDNSSKVKVTYSNSGVVRSYEFESSTELDNFLNHIRKLLFIPVNFKDSELYYCIWCKEFGRKSKFKLNQRSSSDCSDESNTLETSELETNVSLTCTKCNRFLIKDNKIISLDQLEENKKLDDSSSDRSNKAIISNNNTSTPNNPNNLQELFNQTKKQQPSNTSSQSFNYNMNFTLKDVLKSFKTNESSNTNSENTSILSEVEDNLDKKSGGDNVSVNSSFSNTLESTTINTDQNEKTNLTNEEEKDKFSLDDRLTSILGNNQISKIKLDEINQQSRRINNNLKLYLIINVLHESSLQNKQDASSANNKSSKVNDDEEEDLVCLFDLSYFFSFKFDLTSKNVSTNNNLTLENCFCLFTNKNIIVFKIINKDLFEKHEEFEKCIKKEFLIPINKIEIIEVSLGQHYLVIESSSDDKNMNDKKNYLKFVTNDIYRTQSFLSILLKLINESKNVTMLKQIKKKNELTNTNLADLILKLNNTHIDSDLIPIGFYAFVDELKINDNAVNPTFEMNTKNLFLYKNEQLILVEENLSYFNVKTDTKNSLDQFSLIHVTNISDIVHLRLFKEFETKLEISFVDESNNSKQIKWTFNLNKEFLLSQLINQLKTVWEQIFFVELPINF